MPRSRTKHENIITGERIPKKFAFKVERALPTGKVHAHTYDARTLSNWWKTGKRTLPHLGNTPATPAEQARVAAILAAQRPGKMERFQGKPSTRTRSTPGNSSVNWSAPGKRTPTNLVHHPSVPINQLQAAKRATDSVLRKLYSRMQTPESEFHLDNVFIPGNRIMIEGNIHHYFERDYESELTNKIQTTHVHLAVNLDGVEIVFVKVDVRRPHGIGARFAYRDGSGTVQRMKVSDAILILEGNQKISTVKALQVMITRQVISTLRALDPTISFRRGQGYHRNRNLEDKDKVNIVHDGKRAILFTPYSDHFQTRLGYNSRHIQRVLEQFNSHRKRVPLKPGNRQY